MFVALVNGEAQWPLFLHGNTGRGKTCAALALCDWAVHSIYRTVDDLCDSIMDRSKPASPWDWLTNPDLAVLDELGARENVGDLHYSAVKRFTDWREMKSRRVAIYISNHGPDAIEKLYDDRIASRILCGTWFELGGDDRRMGESA